MKISCVYFLYDDEDNLLYVGKTVDFKKRCVDHRRSKAPHSYYFSKAKLFEMSNLTDLEIYESYFINKYKPFYNTDKVYLETPSFELPHIEPVDVEIVNKNKPTSKAFTFLEQLLFIKDNYEEDSEIYKKVFVYFLTKYPNLNLAIENHSKTIRNIEGKKSIMQIFIRCCTENPAYILNERDLSDIIKNMVIPYDVESSDLKLSTSSATPNKKIYVRKEYEIKRQLVKNSHKTVEDKIRELLYLKFQEGQFIPKDKCKSVLQSIYSSLGLDKKAKAVDIRNYFLYKETKKKIDSKLINGFALTKKI